jgi:hypothetical protein
MKSFEAIQRAIQGKTVEHAKRLGKSTSLINKWQEPSNDYTDSGAYNPLDRIEAIVDTAMALGVSRDEALAPVYWLNHRFGLVAFTLPHGSGNAINTELITTIKEFSDLIQTTSTALQDGRISRPEATEIVKEGEEALRAIGALIGMVKESAK